MQLWLQIMGIVIGGHCETSGKDVLGSVKRITWGNGCVFSAPIELKMSTMWLFGQLLRSCLDW